MGTVPDRHTPRRVRLAWAVAMAADAIQLGVTALAFTGPVYLAIEIAVDVAACAALCVILGPHWAFLPTAVIEGVPFVDMVPLWTLAVGIVTRKSRTPPGGPILPESRVSANPEDRPRAPDRPRR